MADLESPLVNPNEQNAPYGSTPAPSPMALTNPDNILSGTNRGVQNLGSPSLLIDNPNSRIKISGSQSTLITGKLGTDNTFGLDLLTPAGNKIIRLGTFPDLTAGFSFYDSSNIRRLHFGSYPDGSVKAKLSKPTFDVTTATNDQLIWSSDFNNFKIVEIGYINVPNLNTGTLNGQFDFLSATYAYNYTAYSGVNPPAVLIYYKDIGGNYHPVTDGYIDLMVFSSGFSALGMNHFTISNAQIYWQYEYRGYLASGSTSQGYGNQTFKVYVLQETAN